jgi:O-antigen ligase
VTSSAAWNLAFGIISVLVIFVLATGVRRSVAIGVLLAAIPFQLVDTRFGSSSVLMAYALGAVLLIMGELRVRLLPAMGFIVAAYLASMAMGDRSEVTNNAVAIFQFFSCLIVFLLAYNYARAIRDERSIVDLLLLVNCLVVVYCTLQLTAAGPGERFVPFGVESLAFNNNRDPTDPRLVGPFANPGTTAGYFTLMLLVLAVDLIYAKGRRRLLVQALAVLNLVGLVATANRTGLIILLAMFPAFLFWLRRELGVKRILAYSIGGAAMLTLAATFAVVYTDFDQVILRMEKLSASDNMAVPEGRLEGWPAALEKVKKDPWFGEGPFFSTPEEAESTGDSPYKFEDLGEVTTSFDTYPHNLYVYLLRTVGIIGLVAVIGFFLTAWFTLFSAARRSPIGGYRTALVRLGVLLVPAFLVSQVMLEFNRPSTMDYAQFIFGLVGLLVGTGDRAVAAESVPEAVAARKRSVLPHSAPESLPQHLPR